MKRALGAVVALLATMLLAMTSSASAADGATVSLMHGIPGAPVDVVVDGAVVIPNFQPATMQDISSFAGQTLTNVEVRAAGTTTVVIGPIASLAIPATGNWTVVAHLDADGKPTLTPYENNTASLPAGQGRLIVRHTAAAPAVDVVLADGTRPFTNLTNPNQASADLPAGQITAAKLAPTGAAPILDIPALDLQAGTDLIAYAVGNLTHNTITFYTQTIDGLGGSPTAVNTGDGPPSSNSTTPTLLIITAALIGLGGTAILTLRRRSSH